jgi:hypothetical protein
LKVALPRTFRRFAPQALIAVVVLLVVVDLLVVAVSHKSKAAPYTSPGDPLGAYQDKIYQPPTPTIGLFVGDENVADIEAATCDTLGWICNTDGVAGSGYVSGRRYASRLSADAAKYPADVVIVTGGGHDDLASADDQATATVDYVNRVHTAYPQAKIVIVTPFDSVSRNVAGLQTLRGALEFTAFGSKAALVDPLGESWINESNSLQYLSLADGSLNPTGQVYVAGRLVAALRAQHIGGA